MKLTTKQALGIIALTVSTLSAIAAPLLLHSPTTQGNSNGEGQDNNNGGNGPGPNPASGTPNTSPAGEQGNGPKKKLQDLANTLESCQTANHGTQRSLMAKIQSAQRAATPSKAEHHLKVLQHQLDTPAAQKHASACLSELQGLVADLLSP